MGPQQYRIVQAGPLQRSIAIGLLTEYLRLVQEYSDDAAAGEELDALLSGACGAFWLALQPQDRAAGCIELRPISSRVAFEIKRLYVRPYARGQGLARQLLRTAEAHARDSGAHELFLDTKSSMVAAIRLYESEGFRRVEAYHDTPHADVFMRKAFLSS